MTTRGTVAFHYDAWQKRRRDFNDVPLADDFEFTGPVASFDSADGYRAMAREAGHAVTSFEVRRRFVDGTRSARSSTGGWLCQTSASSTVRGSAVILNARAQAAAS